MTEFINFYEKNNTGVITLNRSAALNALNLKMAVAFKKKLNQWKKNKHIEGVILKSNGKAFCAGGDIKSICLAGKNSNLKKNFFKNEYELNYAIKSFPKPYLSLWNGIVMGGGVGLSVYGNYRISTLNTKFAMPESAIGFFPDVGTSYIFSRMQNSMGLYLGLTGHVLNYFETYKLGLSNYFINEKDLHKVEEYFINYKKIDNKLTKNIPYYKSNLLKNQKLINNYFSSMNIETIFNNLYKDGSIFAKNILNHLSKRCPFSLALTCKQFKIAKKSSFKKCLHMDYYLSQIMTSRSDFINGVNEVLIKKTHNQKWNLSSFQKINDKIDKYFNNMSTKKIILDI